MNGIGIRAATLGALVAAIVGVGAAAGQGVRNVPPLPFVDKGACPFEGCIYGEWVASDEVVARTERRPKASTVFRVTKGERIFALTGVVVVTKAGRVEFQEPADLESSSGRLRVGRGQTLYLLTYRGEGLNKAWYQGRLYDEVDGSSFYEDRCDSESNRCSGRIVARPVSEWWVQIKNARQQIGWTNTPERFEGKDALAN